MPTTVVNALRSNFDVYIGRAIPGRFQRSIWANPFKIGPRMDREEAIVAYQTWLLEKRDDLLAQLPELRGKILGCPGSGCPRKGCHGLILARLADGFPLDALHVGPPE